MSPSHLEHSPLWAAALAVLWIGGSTGCGSGSGDADAASPVLDGAPGDAEDEPDASRPDAAIDGGTPCLTPCPSCTRCVGGTCQPVEDGTSCGAGACYDGSCCDGCWDGTGCRTGDELTACGTRGGRCDACACEGDTCVDGECAPPLSALSVGAGGAHTCAVLEGGDLYCWGRNFDGELGVGSFGGQRSVPERVSLPVAARTVLAGRDFTCAALLDDSVSCWGANDSGQLGAGDLGRDTRRHTPTSILAPATFTSVSPGVAHTCGLSSAGALRCWGSGASGQLGLGTVSDLPVPTEVGTKSWLAVDAGLDHTCAVQNGGTLWCWGRNTHAQLGLGSGGITEGRSEPAFVTSTAGWTAVTAGDEHSCGIRGDGELWCWGDNRFGQLGTRDLVVRYWPWRLRGSSGWDSVDAGGQHTCALHSSGALSCTGQGADGQLGAGVASSSAVFVVVDLPVRWRALSVGAQHSCGIAVRGALHCWGSGADGRLGTGDGGDRSYPSRVCLQP